MAKMITEVLKLVDAGFTAEAITAMLAEVDEPQPQPQTDEMSVAEYLRSVNESITQLSQQLQANSRQQLGGQLPEQKNTLDVLQARLAELNGTSDHK